MPLDSAFNSVRKEQTWHRRKPIIYHFALSGKPWQRGYGKDANQQAGLAVYNKYQEGVDDIVKRVHEAAF